MILDHAKFSSPQLFTSSQVLVHQVHEKRIPWEIERLRLAYPNLIKAIDSTNILWHNGTITRYAEGKNQLVLLFKTPPTYTEMLLFYPIRNFESDRIKQWFAPSEARATYLSIFKEMYGKTPNQVWNNLRLVRFMPKTLNLRLRFNKMNGAADALEAVGRELDRLPPNFRRYLVGSTTYIQRSIHGTQLTSLHSLGIAIDLNPRFGNYWRWDVQATRQTNLRPKNRIPIEIVQIFEKHGFLWGGRWYFYDTLHFEYRPELFINP